MTLTRYLIAAALAAVACAVGFGEILIDEIGKVILPDAFGIALIAIAFGAMGGWAVARRSGAPALARTGVFSRDEART